MANNIAISYDLKGPGQNYPAVAEKIKALGGWAKVTESFWYVDSTFSAAQARDYILPALDENDKLFVVNATNGQAAWHNLSDAAATYLRKHWTL
jgi:hypothetical protein